MHRAGTTDRAELAVDGIHHFAPHLGGAFGRRDAGRVLDDSEGDGNLALERIGDTDHRNLGDSRVRLHRLLDLARSQTMSGDVDDVVGAAQDKVITVGIAGGPVERGIHLPARNRGEIGLYEALVVAPHRCHAPRRQRRHDRQHAFFAGSDLFPGHLVQQPHVVADDGKRRTAELARRVLDAGLRGKDRPAALRLPVMIHDRHAERVGGPARGRLVERLAGEKQITQARQVEFLHVRGILLLEHANRGRRAEHRAHLVLGDDLPPDAGVGSDRQSLVHDRRRTVDERRVDDVRVTHDPADVAGREHRLAGGHAENVPHRRGERHRIATGIALHTLGLARGARRVQDVRRLRSLEPHAGHLRALVLSGEPRIVQIAAGHSRHRRVELAVDDDHLAGRMLRQPERFVDEVLVRGGLAAAHAGISGDHDLRPRVVDARGKARRGEAAEHDRMDRTDPDRGEHREYGLGDHGHVDQHTIAATHTLRLQNGREAIDLVGELAITVRLMRAGLGRDEDQRGLVAPCGEVPVDSVVAEVGATAHEPAGERRPIVVEDAFERCVPVDERGLLCPESLALVQRSAVGLGVCRQAVLLTRSVTPP